MCTLTEKGEKEMMRKSISVFIALCGLFLVSGFLPAEAKIIIEPIIPKAEEFANISDIVTPDTFTKNADGMIQWKYHLRRFSGDLPPALSYTVERLFSSDLTTVIFFNNPCAIKNRDGDCVKVIIRLSLSVIKSPEQIKMYINGVHLENAQFSFIIDWLPNDRSNCSKQEYKIIIFPDGY